MTTILFVDDDEATLHTFRLLLEHDGYQVVLARSGLEALVKLSENAVDLVITDWSMPDMDGVTLCRTLRSIPMFSSLPVVLISGDQAPAEVALWHAFFLKPVSWSSVAETVRSLVAMS
ncbi:response regulator [Burkholderia multivorans]|uniref:response regulator n=1 Tax=Burkholderia multivorans TaxID=87883 RepID=UPI0018C5FE1E|nr:response regulator [Burkholderia multivorans]MBU9605265.1 response regulator [Burkholderia multivorans]